MDDIATAIRIVEVVAAIAAAMALGDYLGYKIGRWRLATIVGLAVLVTVIAFAIYAAIVLS